MFKLLHVLFNGKVLPAADLFRGGPHCVRHAVWGTSMKVFYRDSLSELRRAVYDVFHAAIRIYRQRK